MLLRIFVACALLTASLGCSDSPANDAPADKAPANKAPDSTQDTPSKDNGAVTASGDTKPPVSKVANAVLPEIRFYLLSEG